MLMKMLFRYMRPHRASVALCISIKLLATICELLLPYILEHIIDDVAPMGDLLRVLLWGALMFAAAIGCRQFNVFANRLSVENAHKVSFAVRQDLFVKTLNLSGKQFDSFGLPSLTSRMTSDSYNVQSAVQQLQAICVRAPMMLIGGLIVTMVMEFHLSLVLICMLPLLILVVLLVSMRGIPLYGRVQERLDAVVRIMRENITGIRVVKALSKTDFEKNRFAKSNNDMAQSDMLAGTVMAIPGPFIQLCLNAGLALVVIIGARRVNAGVMRPGVILAFLTYFNMITMGVMGLSRIFMTLSKASASASRIDAVLQTGTDLLVLPESELQQPAGDEFIRFENVGFSYGSDDDAPDASAADFAGQAREKAIDGISFALRRGESLGIIGPTGCGKTTIINLLMRFYDADEGGIFIDGRDVRGYDKDELRRKFGVSFQNDVIFWDTLRENISFGRELEENDLLCAAQDAMAAEFIDELDEGLDYKASIKGANLSGGQKQRILVSRALAASPEILVLDDSSSALDYKTDAAMRHAIAEHHSDSTLILVAQRVSSVMGMTHILVMDNGRCVGYGSHEELLASCPAYRDIYEIQMGSMR